MNFEIVKALTTTLMVAWLAGLGCAYNPLLYPWRYPEPSLDPDDYLQTLRAAPRPPAGNEWPLSPSAAERLLRDGREIAIHDVGGTQGGITGAMHLQMTIDGQRVEVKFKRAPDIDADGWNDSPRKELATYEIQKWFLDERDYVVPTMALRCIDLGQLRDELGRARRNILGVDCAISSISLWLRNVEVDENFYDPERFASDPNYAYHVANLNLLTYLVDHRDSKPYNFLVSKKASNRRIFAVDNGISFGSVIYNYQVINWNEIRIPALRRASIERLRAVRREDVDALATIIQFIRRGDTLEVVRPEARDETGERLVFGLGLYERDALWKRVQELLRRADAGEIPLF